MATNECLNVYQAIVAIGGRKTLTLDDVQDFAKGRAQVLALMLDHAWHPAPAIRRAAGVVDSENEEYDETGEASEGLRRMRELRDPRHGGFVIDKRKAKWDKRLWEYRLLGEGNFTISCDCIILKISDLCGAVGELVQASGAVHCCVIGF